MHSLSFYGAVFLVLVMGFGESVFAREPAPEADDAIGDLINQRLEAETVKEATEEAKAIAKAKRLEVIAYGERLLRAIDKVSAELASFEAQMEALQTNDQGRAIAANSDTLSMFMSFSKQERPRAREVASWGASVEATIEPARSAGENSIYKPSEAIVDELKSYGGKVVEVAKVYQSDHTKLQAILTLSGSTPGDRTLAEAIQALELQVAMQSLEAEKERTRQANQQIEQAKQEKASRLAKQEAERIRENTEQNLAMKREEAEHQRLLAYAGSDAIRQRYAPFLAKGYKVISIHRNCHDPAGHWKYWRKVNRATPLSKRGLATCGALESVERMVKVAASNNNDRPGWGWPTTEQQWQVADQRFEEMNRLVDAWVELGLLRP